MFVEGCRNGLLVFEYGRCRTTNSGHVRVAQLDKLHKLADKPLHVGSWMIARLAAHTPFPSRVWSRALPWYGPTVRDADGVRQEVFKARVPWRLSTLRHSGVQ